MSTKNNTATKPQEDAQAFADIDDNLVELMEVLEAIDENKAAAGLNEVSMMDNKGGRIYF